MESHTPDSIWEEQIREAELIQSSLLPAEPLHDDSAEIAFRFRPFFQVGGDFLDFFRLPNGLFGLYLGDVVGKGLPATMYAALVMGTLRGIQKTGSMPATVLAQLNDRLMQRPLSRRFCSTLYAVFNPRTRILSFSNAGLPPPQLLSEGQCLLLGHGGLPSGMFPHATYDQHVMQLSPGDSVLFATDGLHESCNQQGIEFCAARMAEMWAQCQSKSAGESLDFLFEGLHAFSDGRPPHDDITALVLKVLA